MVQSLVAWLQDLLAHHLAFTAWIIAAWIVALVVSLWLGRWFLISIPANYFDPDHQPLERLAGSHPALRWTLLIAKNFAGAALIAAGIIMLFTPGQGVLTLLLGFSLVDLPGKRAIERRIIERPAVLHVVNRLRAGANRPPLALAARE